MSDTLRPTQIDSFLETVATHTCEIATTETAQPSSQDVLPQF